VYSREISGELYSFGVSGKLIRNVLVMYDRQTDSLWSQLLGEAVDGPLKGTKLEFVPAVHVSWQEWRERHPDTTALVKGYQGNRDSYASYFGSSQAGVIGEAVQDDRLYTKEFVIGVEQNGQAVAYPFSALNSEPVINHAVGEMPVLVLFAADSGAGVVYDRRVDGQILTFTQDESGRLIDHETGSTWDRWTGEATAGPLTGAQLARVKSTAAFWFGWKDWHPETLVYGADTSS